MPRSLAVLLVLCSIAFPAAAQFTLGDEVVSDTLRDHIAPLLFSAPLAAPAVALAKDSAGVAAAWTMGNAQGEEHVYVARLDAAGRLTGSAREIPFAFTGSKHEVYPSLAAAPGGSGFLLAWMEIDGAMPAFKRVVVSRLDAALSPGAASLLYPGVLVAAPPIVRTKGGAGWVAGGGALASLAQDGTLSAPVTGVAPSDIAIAVDAPLLAGGTLSRSVICACPGLNVLLPCGCPIENFSYSMSLTALPATAQTTAYRGKTEGQPAIGTNGSDALVVWYRPPGAGSDLVALQLPLADLSRFSALAAAPRSLTTVPPDLGPTRPAIAADAQRYVVVWRTRVAPGDHDVTGTIVGRDGKLTPLTIAASPLDETDPSILDLGGGRFLVAYEKNGLFERHIATRLVTFAARRRATK